MKKNISIFLISFFISAFSTLKANNNSGWINILEAGGNNKGELCTQAIQNAINKANKSGGGTIYFPAGNYLTGALKLKSNIIIHYNHYTLF